MDKRKNYLIIGGLVVCAVLLLLLSRFTAPPAGQTVLITLNGNEYKRLNLGRPQEVRIDCGDGQYNVLAIDQNGIWMKEANCRDHSCMDQGRVTPENSEMRALGPSIICLPHRVVCTLVEDGAEDPVLVVNESNNN